MLISTRYSPGPVKIHVTVLTSKKCQDCLPALSQIHRRREEKYFQCGVDRINAMVEQLA